MIELEFNHYINTNSLNQTAHICRAPFFKAAISVVPNCKIVDPEISRKLEVTLINQMKEFIENWEKNQ